MTRHLDRKDTRLAFVGAGRLGSSLALAATRAGYDVAAASSRRPEQRDWLARHAASRQVCADPAEAAAQADVVFLTVSDRAVATLCAHIPWRPDQAVIHCSGALPLDALEHAARRGAAVGGFHPLQTFPSQGSVERLSGVSFAVESPDRALRAFLEGVARDLGGNPFELRSEQRALYHASAVLASGLLLPLVGVAAGLWTRLGMSREQALASLLPLTSASVEALKDKGIPAALTGPFVRGDVETIRGHLQALADGPADVARTYAALALACLPLAAEQGGLSADARAEIESLLQETLNRLR